MGATAISFPAIVADFAAVFMGGGVKCCQNTIRKSRELSENQLALKHHEPFQARAGQITVTIHHILR